MKGNYRDNCNSYNITNVRHIHQSHKVHHCSKKYQQLRPGLLVINQKNFVMYPPSPSVHATQLLGQVTRLEYTKEKY